MFDVEVYGTLQDDSNFELVFESDYWDSCWIDGNTKTNKPFQTWEEAVLFFKSIAMMRGTILIEVSAV